MNTREVLEWLSLAPADIPCWLAAGALAGMWFSPNLTLAILCAIAALVLSLVACYFGVQTRKDFSEVTNVAKLTMYPLFAVIVIMLVCLFFLFKQYGA